jgi:membrane protease YdiL (CAAX protease family)
VNERCTANSPVCMNKGERHSGWRMLPFYGFVLPLLFGGLAGVLRGGGMKIPAFWVNLLFYLLMAGAVCVLFRSFLGNSLQKAFRHPGRVFRGILWGAFVCWTLGAMLEPAMRFVENWNNRQLAAQATQAPLMVFISTVICAPLVEETLFRGLVFGSLRRSHRLLAYGAATVLFCMLHVWQQALRTGDVRSLSLGLEYVAPSVGLIVCYEKSGIIWAPVLLHAGINLCALLAAYW